MTHPPDETPPLDPLRSPSVERPATPAEPPSATSTEPTEAGIDDTRPLVVPPTAEPPPTPPGPTPGGDGPPPPPEPPGDGGDDGSGGEGNRWWLWIAGAAAVMAIVALLLLLGDGEEEGAATTTTAPATTQPGETTTTAVGEPTTTTTPETTTTTTGAETTTTAAETTTTTTVETTTTAAPAAETFVAAADLCVLGHWEGGWQPADPGVSPPVSGGESYQVAQLGEDVDTTTGGAPELRQEALAYWHIAFDPALPGPLGAVAIQTEGDVVPREVAEVEPEDETWFETTRGLLVARGIAEPVVELTRVVQTDLEGDGVTETIVVAFHNEAAGGTLDPAIPGSYGLVYLSKLIDGEEDGELIFVLAESVIPDDADGSAVLFEYELAAVADLNDDGRMEMLVAGENAEGGGMEAFEYVNDDLGPVSVLRCAVAG